jgi:hypothetical protein
MIDYKKLFYRDCSNRFVIVVGCVCWGITWAAVEFGAFIIYWFMG